MKNEQTIRERIAKLRKTIRNSLPCDDINQKSKIQLNVLLWVLKEDKK